MKPSYEELEEQLNRSRRLCDAALANERVWETAMMQACGEDGPKSVADKFAELKAQCAALAAENAGLKNQLRELFNSCDTGERRGNGSLSGAAVPDWCVLEKTRQFLESTPATDAFLAEVRAQGVESAGEYLKQYAQGLHEEARLVLQDAGELCNGFAAQLRKGVQS